MMVLLALGVTMALTASTLAHPMPQVPNMSGEDKNTGINPGKCTVPQYSEMIFRLNACEKAQDHEHLNNLLLSLEFTKPELRRALCTAAWAKLDCFLEEAPLCLEEDRLQRAEGNIIHTHFEILFNQTKTLGKEVMDECSFVKAKQSQVMMRLADSDKCTFYDYENRRIAMQECRAEVKKARYHRLDFLRIAPDKPEYFRRLMCQDKADGLACSSEYKKCLGPRDLAWVDNDEDIYYTDLENQAKEIEPRFDYDTTCGASGYEDVETDQEEPGDNQEVVMQTKVQNHAITEEEVEMVVPPQSKDEDGEDEGEVMSQEKATNRAPKNN